MAEKKVVVRDLELSYEGLFDAEEMLNVMETLLREKWWEKKWRENEEFRNPDGTKQIIIHAEPWKKITDYYRALLKYEIVGSNLREVEVELEDGTKKKLSQGRLTISFHAWMVTDYWSKWDENPFLFFIKVLIERFPYKMYYNKYARVVRDDLYDLFNATKNYLNMQKEKFKHVNVGATYGV